MKKAADAESIPRRYQTALAGCSQTLLHAASTPAQRLDLLNEALAYLVEVVRRGPRLCHPGICR